MNVIKASNPTWDVIFTATASNTLLDDDDEMYYIFFESALKREVKEECNIDIEVGWIVGIYSEKNNPVVLAVFHTEWVEGDLNSNDQETLDVDMFKVTKLPDLAFEHDSKIIKDWEYGLKLRFS